MNNFIRHYKFIVCAALFAALLCGCKDRNEKQTKIVVSDKGVVIKTAEQKYKRKGYPKTLEEDKADMDRVVEALKGVPDEELKPGASIHRQVGDKNYHIRVEKYNNIETVNLDEDE